MGKSTRDYKVNILRGENEVATKIDRGEFISQKEVNFNIPAVGRKKEMSWHKTPSGRFYKPYEGFWSPPLSTHLIYVYTHLNSYIWPSFYELDCASELLNESRELRRSFPGLFLWLPINIILTQNEALIFRCPYPLNLGQRVSEFIKEIYKEIPKAEYIVYGYFLLFKTYYKPGLLVGGKNQ